MQTLTLGVAIIHNISITVPERCYFFDTNMLLNQFQQQKYIKKYSTNLLFEQVLLVIG